MIYLKDKKEIFNLLLEELEKGNNLMNEYDSIPRFYNDILLYQVECHTIQVIGKYKNIKTYELAEIMNKTNSAVSQIVKKLDKKGLVNHFRNPENNREVILSLTMLGEEVYKEHELIDYKAIERLFELVNQFSVEEMVSYIKIQQILNKQFTKDVELSNEIYNLYKNKK